MARPISAVIPTNTLEGKKEYMKLYWLNNPDKKKLYGRKYYIKNKVRMNIKSLEYHEANREDRLLKFKEYNQKNRSKRMDSWRKGYQNRRARLAGVPSETYTRASIVSLYGDVCHICSSVIDMTLKFPEKLSFSFDHLKPLSMGGDNLISNIRPSHLTCNRKKANVYG